MILDLCLNKTRAGKSRDYYDVTVSKMFHSTLKRKAAVFKLKSVFEKFCFCDRLVWKVGLIV